MPNARYLLKKQGAHMSNRKIVPTKDSSTTNEQETVIAPGGSRLKSSTVAVDPGQALRRTIAGVLEVVSSGQNTKPDGSPAIATDMVLTPGGFRASSVVHHIESGAVIDGAGHQFKKMSAHGAMLADLGVLARKATGQPLMPLNVAHDPARVPALGSGWICYASWTENAQPVSLFTTTWTVPPPPATQSGQTIFLFNGIQNESMIYQPVLQWGPSAAGGGSFWAVASWYADGQGGQSFYSSLVPVTPGQVLVGVMTETGQSAQGFSYNCQFTGIANTSLPIQNVEQLTWCVQTLECYNVQACSDYPATSKTAMREIEIKASGQTVTPAWTATNTVVDCGQHAVVVSNASPGGEVDLYYNNSVQQGFLDKLTLGETSTQHPSLASLNGLLYLAWTGDGNNKLNVLCSADNGHSFVGKYTSTETSSQAASLATHNGLLFLGWKGNGNDNLNVARGTLSGDIVTGISNKITLGDTSSNTPVLASFNGVLYLAWTGTGNNQLNIMSSTDNGATFHNKFTSQETSSQGPGLTQHNGALYIAWKGNGNADLNVAQVDVATNPISLIHKVTLAETSSQSPTLASANGKLYLGWKGNGNNNLNVAYSTNDGATFLGKYVSPETSTLAPVLCEHTSSLFVAWTGVGNDKLNVAEVID
jgi:hypothetical protein